MRTRTELECLVEDLKAAKERTCGKEEGMEAVLEAIYAQIMEKEKMFEGLLPEWDGHRATEAEEQMFLGETQAHLYMLHERQDCLSHFRTRQERDELEDIWRRWRAVGGRLEDQREREGADKGAGKSERETL